MELNDTIAVICVILAVILAIYSTPVRNMLLEAVGPMGDLVLFIIDGARKINRTDIEAAKKIKHKKVIIVMNKIDLKKRADITAIGKILPRAPRVMLSALKKQGLAILEKQITRMVFKGEIIQEEDLLIGNLRQKKALEECYTAINNQFS